MYLRDGNVDMAIDCYDKAIELGDKEQEGVLLVMRGTALLQRAYASRYLSIIIDTHETLNIVTIYLLSFYEG